MTRWSLGDYGADTPSRFYAAAKLTRSPTEGAYLVGLTWSRYDDRLHFEVHPAPFVHALLLFSKLQRAARGRWDEWKPLLRWRRERELPDRRVTWAAMLDLSDWLVGVTWYADDLCTQVHVHPVPLVTVLYEQVKREAYSDNGGTA